MPYGDLVHKVMAETHFNEKYQLDKFHELLGVNPEKKEYEEFNGKHLIIMVCSQCNINCKHCYISYKGNRTPEELINMVNLLKDKYIIELNGAEILTNLDYLKAYKIIGQRHLISNGKAILNNPDTIDKLKENDIGTVALSYHFGIQDNLSPVTEEELNEIIKTLQDNDIEVRLMTTINSRNFYRIREICEKASDIGARAVKFTNYINQGRANQTIYDDTLTDDQKKYFFEQIEKERDRYNIDDLLIERCGTFGKNTHSNKDNFKCIAASDSVVLTPDNSIYPCVFLAKPGYEIGEYRDNKIYVQKDLQTSDEECLSDKICNKTLIYRKERR